MRTANFGGRSVQIVTGYQHLAELSDKLKGFSYGAQTDLLVGLPGETFDSHLNSYNKALAMGLTHIFQRAILR